MSGAFRTGRAEARNQTLRVIEVVVADPGERQIGERHVVLGQLVEGNRIGCGIDRTFAGEDDTFGCAGGAGRVENDRRVGTLAGGNLVVEPGGDRGICASALRPSAMTSSIARSLAVIVIAQPRFSS